jgi:hypothetical protein
MLPAVSLPEHWPTWVVFDFYGIRQQWMGAMYVCFVSRDTINIHCSSKLMWALSQVGTQIDGK